MSGAEQAAQQSSVGTCMRYVFSRWRQSRLWREEVQP